MQTVQQLLDSKGHDVLSIPPNATVFEAIRTMAEHEIGALVVLERGTLAGIITERDYARKIILKNKRSRETRVVDIMTRNPVTVTPDQHVEQCISLMTDRRTRHLPVVHEGCVVGIVSIGDVVKAIMTQQEFMIAQLESYITGSPRAND